MKQQEQMQVDPNKVIEFLSAEVARLSREKAIVQATAEQLVEENKTLKELVAAYEDKEKLVNEKSAIEKDLIKENAK